MLLKFLNQIAKRDLAARRAAVTTILESIGTPFAAQSALADGQAIHNLIVPLHDDNAPFFLVGAHYDAAADSPGANDNAAGAAIALLLLQITRMIRYRNGISLPLEFVFLDASKRDFLGSQLYLHETPAHHIAGMINLDLCGVGDTLLVATGKHSAHSILGAALAKAQSAPQSAAMRVDALPPGDDMPFEIAGVPTLSLSVAPEYDVEPMQTYAQTLHNGGGYVDVMPSVVQMLYNRAQDRPEVVQEAAMRQVMMFTIAILNALREAQTEAS